MQHAVSQCHIDVAPGREFDLNVSTDTPRIRENSEQIFEYPAVQPHRRAWAPSPAETIAGTASRHSSPRQWRRALERAVAAGLLQGATPTTLTVAQDLADRMDYGTGHVRYRLTETMARTGLGRSTVTKHVALLRAAGWLAWAQHGSLRNVLRGVGRPGYAATAAVYAATIPPAFDEWAGNRLGGRGYAARVVGATERGREQRVAEAVDNSQRKASDRAGSEGPWTPSLRGVKEEGQVQLEGGFCSTAQRQQKRRTILGQTITAAAVTQAERLAAWVRPLVGWLQRATRRQLSWVLLDLVLLGWDEQRILGWLREHNQLTTWRPRFPHRQIAAKLLALQADEQRIADLDAEQARRSDPAQNAELQQALAAWRLQAETADALLAASTGRAAEPKAAGRYTNAERRQAREYALDERFGGLALVSDLMAEDLDAALDLYGMGLCRRAECMDAIGALA